MDDTPQAAARAAHAEGASVVEIAEAMGESPEQVAEWLAVECRRKDVDPWTLVQELVADARDQLAAANASGNVNASKSLVGALGRLAPVLARLEETRREDGIRILPAELASAKDRVRALVDAALGRRAP